MDKIRSKLEFTSASSMHFNLLQYLGTQPVFITRDIATKYIMLRGQFDILEDIKDMSNVYTVHCVEQDFL